MELTEGLSIWVLIIVKKILNITLTFSIQNNNNNNNNNNI